MKSILITGATGFIGQHLINELSKKERDLNLISRGGANNSISVDLTCNSETNKIISSCNVGIVVHLASSVRAIRSSIDVDKEISMAINVISALKPPCRFIYLSTADEYASSPNLISENANLDPANLYAKAKFRTRKALEAEAQKIGIELIVLRPFLVYGLYQPAHMFIPQLLKSINDNEVFVYSSRRKVRDFIHVSDIVKAIRMLIDYKENISGTYNIGTGVETSLSKAIKMVENKTGKIINIERDARLGIDNPDIIVANSKKIETKIGWRPEVSLQKGLSELIKGNCSF
jgi:nucleoside-diphosphate-sugar epimerase